MSFKNSVCVSLVNHKHGDITYRLVDWLTKFPEVNRIILTQNLNTSPLPDLGPKCLVINNPRPRGFAANHNSAFARISEPFFCVINPDIELRDNPFPAMLEEHRNTKVAVVGPVVLEPNGLVADSARHFPTAFSLLLRLLWSRNVDSMEVGFAGEPAKPYWIAGMFMLFKTEMFQRLGGFDERYFLYFEDVDICRRILRNGMSLSYCTEAKVIHHAQRASRRQVKYLLWHLRSAILYFSTARN